MLHVLRDTGLRIQSGCEAGTCGTCPTRVLDGGLDHRNTYLPEAQRAARCDMRVCVSRARSRQLVLDL